MNILLAEIWLCLFVSALLGVAAGWLLWGRSNQRLRLYYRGRLAKLRRNWETVEDQLATALARVSELEGLLHERASEASLHLSEPEPSDDVWEDEARVLETTVRGLEERIRSLETSQALQDESVDSVPHSGRLARSSP
jgi:hypothetical protein